MDVDFGWFADTIHFGDYPELVKSRYADQLPVFTDAERALLKKVRAPARLHGRTRRFVRPHATMLRSTCFLNYP